MMATVLWMSALRNDGLQQRETRRRRRRRRRRRNVKAYLWAFAIQAVSIAQKNKQAVDVLD